MNGQFEGYDIEDVRKSGSVVNDTLGGEPIVVVYERATRSGIAYSRDVNGQALEFYHAAGRSLERRHRETGSLWNSEGHAVDGELAGAALSFVPSYILE